MGNVPGGLSTVKSKKFDDIKEEENENPTDLPPKETTSQEEKKKLQPTVTEPMTPRTGMPGFSPRQGLVRNPTEKTLNQPSQLSYYDQEEIKDDSTDAAAKRKQKD